VKPRGLAGIAALALISAAVGYGAYSYLRVDRPKFPLPPDDPRCPPRMAYIPAGVAQIWDDPPPEPPHVGIYRVAPIAEQRTHDVNIAAFCLDRTDVTVEDYAGCVRAGQCAAPVKVPQTGDMCNYDFAERALHPVNCVRWDDAKRYCDWKGGRLPSYEEWFYAAHGGVAHNAFPWGNGDGVGDGTGLGCRSAWTHRLFSTCPVRSFPNESFGLFDMGGNVSNYTADPELCPGFDSDDDVTQDQELEKRQGTHYGVFGPSPTLGLRCAR
jgi:formylglycine-generating enzyme required for sulfatase activity